MKYLKYIIGIIALLFIGFLLIGLIKPEASYDSEIMVEKPIAESWAVIQDEGKLVEWLPGFQKLNMSVAPQVRWVLYQTCISIMMDSRW